MSIRCDHPFTFKTLCILLTVVLKEPEDVLPNILEKDHALHCHLQTLIIALWPTNNVSNLTFNLDIYQQQQQQQHQEAS